MSDKKPKYKDLHGTTRVGDFLRKVKDNVEQYAPSLLTIASGVPGLSGLKDLADKIEKSDLPNEDKEIALTLIQKDIEDAKQETERMRIAAEHETAMEKEVSERWKSDMQSDSWLSKNTRPIIVLFLVFSTVLMVAIDGVERIQFILSDDHLRLLEWLTIAAVTAYFGLRTMDKRRNPKGIF